ncbi:MAG: hydroxyacid dehydrogenase, partial [Candidatus Marinimicrobia bacterium]|nr:hydroxyacid dehydrogenase [Candidatus Neomarinimicrobiota bacterium]
GFRGFDLKDKKIGIIGGGHIGMHVARMANGFEMKTLVFDIKKNKRLSKKFKFKYVKLDYLLKNSDVITLHVPLNKYTKHMINTKNLKKIKKGALLINTARGELIETIAIMKGLANKTFKAAGLDVLEGEGRIREEKELLHDKFIKERDLRTHLQNHILLNQENVVITPHNAFNSREALQRILDTTVDNIKAFKRKKNINVVNNKV